MRIKKRLGNDRFVCGQTGSAPSPRGSLFLERLSGVDHHVPLVAGALRGGHTAALLVQVGLRGTAAAVHRAEGHLAGRVGLAEAKAGRLAAGQTVGVDQTLGAAAGVFGCRKETCT